MRTSKIPKSIRGLLEEFRDGLLHILKRNLVGVYLFGSVAFPEYQPEAADIDFYVVTRDVLNKREIDGLDILHRFLASKFELGRRLDGFYIPQSQARQLKNPRDLVDASHGRVHQGAYDDTWALHREHFHSSAHIRLYGPSAGNIFPTADWPSIRMALLGQLHYGRSIIDSDPWWSVLNLCRLIFSFQEGRIVISKLEAARWALKALPARWRPVIRSAVRAYKQEAGPGDRALLRKQAREFLGFASVRIIAFDTTWDSRQPHIAHLRKTRKQGRRLSWSR